MYNNKYTDFGQKHSICFPEQSWLLKDGNK